jgi:1-acyl-sn-glycerol-3-phosphate acyltransferase
MPNARSVVLVLWTIGWAVIGLTAAIIDPTKRLYLWLAQRHWATQILWLAGVGLSVRGAENADWKRPYVIVANHQSQLDIPVLMAGLPGPIRFLAKRSLFFIPLFGWSMWLAGFIPVDRGRSRRARASVRRAAERIRRGPSLVVFPEGTRSPTGEVQRFKSGAFVLAIRSGVPILPLAVRGTFEVVPRHRLSVEPGPVELIVGRPIETAGKSMADKEDLRRAAREAVIEMHRTGEPSAL